MHDIICPHCSKAFKVDEAGYADILKQVRDRDFEQQLAKRLALAEQEKRNAIDLAMARKQTELQELEAQLRARDVKQELAVKEAVSNAEKQRDLLASELQQMRETSETAARMAETRFAKEIQTLTLQKEGELRDLKAQLQASGMQTKLAVAEALSAVEKERDELRNNLSQSELKHQLDSQSMKERYELQIHDRDQAIERLRDMKARLSTKMVGETLSNTAKRSSIASGPQHFPGLTSRKTTTPAVAAKGITSFATAMRPRTRSFQSCLK